MQRPATKYNRVAPDPPGLCPKYAICCAFWPIGKALDVRAFQSVHCSHKRGSIPAEVWFVRSGLDTAKVPGVRVILFCKGFDKPTCLLHPTRPRTMAVKSMVMLEMPEVPFPFIPMQYTEASMRGKDDVDTGHLCAGLKIPASGLVITKARAVECRSLAANPVLGARAYDFLKLGSAGMTRNKAVGYKADPRDALGSRGLRIEAVTQRSLTTKSLAREIFFISSITRLATSLSL